MATLIDSFTGTADGAITQVYGNNQAGQDFAVSGNNFTLTSVQLALQRVGSPTGSGYAEIYAFTGTYGTNGLPTGSALATSDAIDVSTISTSINVFSTLTFSGSNQITLTAGSYYFIVFSFTGGDTSNYIYFGWDSTGSHGDSAYLLSGGSWTHTSGAAPFYAYGNPQHSITKSLEYTTPTITLSARFIELAQERAITKSLQYVASGTSTNVITKSLRYGIGILHSITKSLHYEVRGHTALTKPLKYTVKTSIDKTKSVKYAIKTTPVAKTKSLHYEVLTHTAITKSLRYGIGILHSITKSLHYEVRGHTALTKSLKYAVKTTPTAKTKSLAYAIGILHFITKSAWYVVRTTHDISKSARYAIGIAKTQTKSLEYDVRPEHDITKSLRYAVLTHNDEIKSDKYAVKTTPPAKTKSLAYRIGILHAITKSARYTIGIARTTTKSLRYAVLTHHDETKADKYTVKTTPAAKTKSLAYEVKTTEAITKSARYVVKTEHQITKDLQYIISHPAVNITKSAKYAIVIQKPAFVKYLRYAIGIARTTTKSIHYEVRHATAITKSAAYKVIAAVTRTKTLKYGVHTTKPAITKTVLYKIALPPVSITKSLRYAVGTSPSQTKPLKYTVIRSLGAIPKTLLYVCAVPIVDDEDYSKQMNVIEFKTTPYILWDNELRLAGDSTYEIDLTDADNLGIYIQVDRATTISLEVKTATGWAVFDSVTFTGADYFFYNIWQIPFSMIRLTTSNTATISIQCFIKM